MAKQALVIGLGRLGSSLARELSARGVEVLAVDRNPKLVEEAVEYVAEAAAFDASDEEELASAQPAERDLCICAIGEVSREASILCTALLRQLGAPRIIARATSKLHGRILRLVGAHEVVNPLEDFSHKIADQIAYTWLRGELPLGGGLLVAEIDAPEELHGKQLRELQLPSRFKVNVVATRRRKNTDILLPKPDQEVQTGDVLVVVAKRDDLTEMLKAMKAP